MTGRALEALNDAIARTLAALRIFAVASEVAVVVYWHSWYLTPAHAVVPAVAAVWGIGFAVGCLRTGLTRPLVAGDFAVALLLAAAAPQALTPDALERGPNWLLVRLIGTSIAVAWAASPRTWALGTSLLAATTGASYLASGVPARNAVVAAVLVLVTSALLAGASKIPRRGALEADAALAQAGTRRQVHEVTARRERELRENERILHDTVLNTLTGLGWSAPDSASDHAALDVVRTRCRHSVAVCTDFLAGAGEPEVDAGLVTQLNDVVDDARRGGLRVEVSTADHVDVPADVATALAATAREALSNVRRHAGTMHAWLTVRAHAGEVWLTVVDEGTGFDPASTGPDRLGLRNSIVERIADVGGSTEVRTAPGRGTTVVAHWSPRPAPEAAVLAETALLEATYARDAVRTFGAAVSVWQAGLGLLLVAHRGHYGHPGLVVTAWALSSLALALCVVNALRLTRSRSGSGGSSSGSGSGTEIGSGTGDSGGTGDRSRTGTDRGIDPTAHHTTRTRRRHGLAGRLTTSVLTAAVLAAQVAVGFSAPYGDRSSLVWVLLAGDGVICFLSVSRPGREWLPAAGTVVVAAVVVTFLRHDADASVVTRVAGLLYALGAVLVGVAMFLRSRRATIRVTVLAAAAEANLAAERAVAVAVRHDRSLRLRQLAAGPLPLLTGIGTGERDPFDPAVRRDCASLASALRRTLTSEGTRQSLVTVLEPAILAAERRGAFVEVQIGGDVSGMPPGLEAEVDAAVGAVLAGIDSGQALMTLVGDATEGSMIVSFPESRSRVSSARTAHRQPERRYVDVVEEVEDGRVCVEIAWGAPRLDLAPR